MVDKKITQLDEVISASPTDVGVIVSSGSTSKITLQNMFLAGNQGLSYIKEVELYRNTLSASGIFDIGSISQDYDHLKIFVAIRSTVSATNDGLYIYLNNDNTVADYYSQFLISRDAGTLLTESSTPSSGLMPAATSASSTFGMFEILIPLYTNTSMYKTISSRFVSYTAKDATIYGGVANVAWESVLAINQITLLPDGYPTDMLAANSFCQIIGIKTIS